MDTLTTGFHQLSGPSGGDGDGLLLILLGLHQHRCFVLQAVVVMVMSLGCASTFSSVSSSETIIPTQGEPLCRDAVTICSALLCM